MTSGAVPSHRSKARTLWDVNPITIALVCIEYYIYLQEPPLGARSAGEPVVCAAIRREGDYVHLASPLLTTRYGVCDPAGLFAAVSARHGLHRCRRRHDDLAGLGMFCRGRSSRSSRPARSTRVAVALRTLRRQRCHAVWTKRADPRGPKSRLAADACSARLPAGAHQADPAECPGTGWRADRGDFPRRRRPGHAGDRGRDRAVLVTLLADVKLTDVVRQGLPAHQQMTVHYKSKVQCLLVAPTFRWIDRCSLPRAWRSPTLRPTTYAPHWCRWPGTEPTRSAWPKGTPHEHA